MAAGCGIARPAGARRGGRIGPAAGAPSSALIWRSLGDLSRPRNRVPFANENEGAIAPAKTNIFERLVGAEPREIGLLARPYVRL
jgi:hypothetical protein